MQAHCVRMILVCLTFWFVGGCRSSSDSTKNNIATTSPQEGSSKEAATSARATKPSVVAWRSVREHAGLGPLSVTLQGAPGTPARSEPRVGGIQELQVDFSSPMKLADAKAVRVTTKEGSVKPTAVLLQKPTCLVIRFEGLKKGCYRVSIQEAIEGLSGDSECTVRVLEGDVNGDGRVNLNDAMYIKSRVGQDVSEATAALDLNESGGKIEMSDSLRAKASAGQAVNCN